MSQQENHEIRISPDALIALVVAEAEEREISAMPSLKDMNKAFHPSEAFQKKMNKLLRRAKHRQARKGIWRTAKRLFVAATTVVTMFTCALMPVQAVRDAAVSTVLNWREHFVEVVYSRGTDPDAMSLLQNVTLTYLPEGFVETDSATITPARFNAEYQASQGEWLTVRILSIQDEQTIAIDNENSSIYQLSFDGHDVVWSVPSDGSNILLWESNGLSYQISSTCDLSELIKVAEGIRTETT